MNNFKRVSCQIMLGISSIAFWQMGHETMAGLSLLAFTIFSFIDIFITSEDDKDESKTE